MHYCAIYLNFWSFYYCRSDKRHKERIESNIWNLLIYQFAFDIIFWLFPGCVIWDFDVRLNVLGKFLVIREFSHSKLITMYLEITRIYLSLLHFLIYNSLWISFQSIINKYHQKIVSLRWYIFFTLWNVQICYILLWNLKYT